MMNLPGRLRFESSFRSFFTGESADGRPFFVDSPLQAIGLCFSNASDEEVKEAVRQLAKALDESCA